MRTWIAAVLGAACLGLVSCGSSEDPGTPGAEQTVDDQTAEAGGAGTDTGDVDGPAEGGDQPAVDLPGLPIGGSVVFDAGTTTTCAFIAWNGTIPDGVVVRITDLGYPAGVGEDSGATCDGRPCLGADSFTPDEGTCSVALVWDGTPPAADDTSITAAGTAVCASQEACDQLAAEAASNGGSALVTFPEVDTGSGSTGSETTEPESASPTESS